MSSKIVYAIPSYNRSDVISDKTLATLRRGGVALSDIYIFVIDGEVEQYKNTCKGYQIQVGLLGLVPQRSFIQGFFPKDTFIVMIDDDIESLWLTTSEKTKQEVLDIPGLISQMKIRMISEQVSICGIYPCNNLKFSFNNKEVTTDFRYLVGAFYLIKNLRLPDVQLDSSECGSLEDRLRTILYYKKEKKCLRFNHIIAKTSYFAPGGLWSENRLKIHKSESEALVSRFPQYLRLAQTKKYTDAKCRKITPGI